MSMSKVVQLEAKEFLSVEYGSVRTCILSSH